MPRLAAIDVGSNSIRLLIADVDALGRITPIHEDREVVRLGTGVFRNGRLCGASMSVACRVLARMAEAIERHRVASVRAVGTSALRDASNRSELASCRAIRRASPTSPGCGCTFVSTLPAWPLEWGGPPCTA